MPDDMPTRLIVAYSLLALVALVAIVLVSMMVIRKRRAASHQRSDRIHREYRRSAAKLEAAQPVPEHD
jgi:hypothetical protein